MTESGKTQVKLEEKILEFEFEILQVQYNKYGNFYLRLSIQNMHREDLLPQTSIEVNKSGIQRPGHQIATNTIKWDENSTSVNYEQHSFKFKLPKGFCKNDGKYDVYLLIEAFRVPEKSGKKSQSAEKMGVAKFAIYPRTDLPRANLYVKKGENYYNYSDVLTLLRPLTRASISMHCGRLSFKVAFHEYLEPGFVFVDSEDESEVPPSPVSEEPELSVLEDQKTPSVKDTIIQELNRKYSNLSPEPEPVQLLEPEPQVLEKVKSMDRTTQWTPQTESMFTLTPETMVRENTFHLDIPDSPVPEDTNHPANREVRGLFRFWLVLAG